MPTPNLPPPASPDPCAAPAEYCDEAYRAIGKFIVSFAQAEVGLSMIIDNYIQRRVFKISYSRQGTQILAALSGGIRMEKLRTLAINAAKRLDSQNKNTDLVISSSHHLGDLANFRNRLVHYGGYPIGKDGRWIIQTSNKYNVNDYEKREMWRYSIETLEAASEDCYLAKARISYALFPEDRELLENNMTNYTPLAPFAFRMSMIEREKMP